MTATRKTRAPSRNGRAAPSTTGVNGGRDPATGRFGQGNAFSRGNPHNRRVAQLRTAALDAVTPDQMRDLVKHLYGMAMGGDTSAAKLVMEYTVGRPAKCVDVDRLDLDELAIVLESPDVEQTCRRGQVHPALAVREVLRALVSTPQGLLEALEEKFQELREDLQRRAPPGEWLELEDIARDAGLGGDDDEDE